MAFDLEESIFEQKRRFCGLEQGPRCTRNILHIVDLYYVPKNEKEMVKDLCLKRAGSLEGNFIHKYEINKKMSESENRLKIINQTSLNKIDLNIYVEWDAWSEITWVDCRFGDLDLLGTIFRSCNFNNLSLRKCQFSNCTFQNCQTFKCDLNRAEFTNSNLNLILTRSVKVCKSK